MLSQYVENTKVAVLGVPEIDKKVLVRCFLRSEVTKQMSPLEGVTRFSLQTQYQKQNVGIDMWNIDIDDKFKQNASTYFRDARIAIAFYDKCNEKSFLNMQTWIKGFIMHTDFSYNMEIYIISIKSKGKTCVKREDVDNYAKRVQAKVYNISRLSFCFRSQYSKLFQDLFKGIVQYNQRYNNKIVLNSNTPSTSGTSTAVVAAPHWSTVVNRFFYKILFLKD